MKPITFDSNCYWIDGRPIYLNSGEFHYFRVPKPDWRRRMELFKEAGGNCLATYIPWLIHEPEEGHFVFDSGDGTTDLEGFLETARETELYVIARPGPYQYSELIYGGLPSWLFDRYPEVQAHTLEGRPFGLPSVSYLHPTFLTKARAWFDAVCPLLAGQTVQRGGPIAFTQFDNELMGVHIWFGGLDYNAEAMGFGDPEGHYPRFLADRYGSLIELNEAYAADYESFTEVRPISSAEADPGRTSDIRRLRDYFHFYLHVTTVYAQTLCAWLRDHGVDTPLIHNSANPDMNAYFVEMVETLGEDFLLGSDHYYNLDQTWPQNNPTPQYARNVLLSNESLRLLGYPPTILELPSGSCSDWPPITASDAHACYMTNLAYGMKGHNYYVFTGGPNPPGAGETTDLYDYGAPIGAHGQVRPLYEVQAAFGQFIDDHPWLVQAEREHDIRFAINFESARADRYWQARGDLLFTNAEAWRFLAAGLLTTGLCASLSPVCVNLDADDWVDDTATPLIVATGAAMSQAHQERIVAFLQRGGRALIAPVLPTVDETFVPCTVLSDFLGAPSFRRGVEAVIRVVIKGVEGEIRNVLKNEVFFAAPPEDAVVVGYDECTDAPLAWEVATSGGGRVILLGMTWEHRKDEQSQALLALLNRLGLSRVIISTNPAIWLALRTRGSKSLLFMMNLFSSSMKTKVVYRPGSGGQVDLGEHQIEAMSVKAVEVRP